MKIEIEYSEEEKKEAQELTQKYRDLISKNTALMSLLYDIDLMPEQIVLQVNAMRMVAVCELFKMTLHVKETPSQQP